MKCLRLFIMIFGICLTVLTVSCVSCLVVPASADNPQREYVILPLPGEPGPGYPKLHASPSLIQPGGVITVEFVSAPGNQKDFIALYKTGVADTGGFVERRFLNGLTSGTLTFTAPPTTGTYEFRMFENDSWKKLATSNTVTVGIIAASPAQVSPGQSIIVEFVSAPGNQKDFIALYKAGVADGQPYVSYKYLNGATSGTFTFTAPSIAGTYEFRMFEDDSWKKLGTSNLITVIPISLSASPASVSPGQSITVTFSGAPGNQDDMVALFPYAAKAPLLAFQYLRGKTSGTLIFSAPSSPGNYEFHLIPQGSRTPLAVCSIKVSLSIGRD